MIRGKIARILSDTEVVLNVGSKQGVERGMEFVIFSLGDPIIDPDSKNQLGAIETVKGRLIVSHVMEDACRARTNTYTTTEPSPYETLGIMDMMRPRTVTRHHTLQVRKEDLQPVPSEDRTVHVGDSVRSVPTQ